MANVLQPLGYNQSLRLPLRRHLVSDAPHDYGSVVAEMMEHVYHVSLRPYPAVSAVLVEESVVSVLAFGDVPFVEVLAHDHESHLVAKLDQLFGRHVVRGAYRVAAHVLQHRELAADGSFIDSRSERTEVMVEADSAELALLSVEEESLVRDHLNRPETESCADLVLQVLSVPYAYFRPVHVPVGVDRSACIDLCLSRIKDRVLWRPQGRASDRYVLLHLSLMYLSCVCLFSHDASLAVDDPGLYRDCRTVLHSVYLCPDPDGRMVIAYVRGGHICSPYRYVNLRQGYVTDFSVQAGSGIPP